MSISYTSTSFGTAPTPSSSRPSRHQRQHSRTSSSASSASYTTGELPPPVSAAAPRQPEPTFDALRMQYDQLGAFFGSQRQQPSPSPSRSHAPGDSETRILPSYDSQSELESLPAYSKVEEYDANLNRKLFIYGFLFFPFWIVGVVVPFIRPLRDPARDNRSKEDQEADNASVRQVELRWAKRSGIALSIFTILVIIAVTVGVTVANRH